MMHILSPYNANICTDFFARIIFVLQFLILQMLLVLKIISSAWDSPKYTNQHLN